MLYSGLRGKSKADFEDGNARYITYKNIFANAEVDTETLAMVKVDPSENQNQVQYGDVLFTGSSENTNDVGMSCAVTFQPTEPIYLNSFCFGLRFHDDAGMKPEFAKHLFRSESLREQIRKTGSGVTRINVSKALFKQIPIPIPPLEEQRRIVEILDRFSTLCESITEGLPREIELRRQQYAYYREQLLTFPQS